MNPARRLEPIIFGGTGNDSANQEMPATLPEKFEPGTLNVAGIAGLNAALKWLQTQTVEKIFEAELKNRSKLVEILSGYKFLRIVGNVAGRNYIGIATRAGLQCSPLAHKFLGTYPAGTVRFSVNNLELKPEYR